MFHNIESTKDKMLEADPYLERKMTSGQAIEKNASSENLANCKVTGNVPKIGLTSDTNYKY